jgi:hypothetical protein
VKFSDNKTLYTNAEGFIRRGLDKATDYTASTSLEGYMNESVSFTTKKQAYGTVKKELYVEKVEVGKNS